jgi:uncharacterized protein with HEPN domain
MKDHEKIILKKITTYAEQAIHFRDNMNFSEFSNDFKTISACVFNLSQIGELVGRLDRGFVNMNNHIPWRKIKGMRNKIVHDYEGIKYNIVWDVLTEFLPELIENIDNLIKADDI